MSTNSRPTTDEGGDVKRIAFEEGFQRHLSIFAQLGHDAHESDEQNCETKKSQGTARY